MPTGYEKKTITHAPVSRLITLIVFYLFVLYIVFNDFK